ncbi:hypothetical protein [Pseudomonas laurylsulfativorans]|uniref:hypothetical protein n=1 Tax=Pseudomonas laurylsulfativorans TaxID=1943631 RepID=UPI001F0CB6A8|nr:hypothetical protein [Pseudomonas laurylsulfativorans]
MVERYDRATLLEEVWSEPVQVVAPRYGLSDVGLKKLCTRLQIPTPPRGHWAKVKASKRVSPRPKLREYTGYPGYLYRPSAQPSVQDPAAGVVDSRLQRVLSFEQQPENQIVVPERIKVWHPVVTAAREALLRPFIDQRGMPQTRGNGLNISVSPALQSRALKVVDTLLKALEKRGYTVQQGQHRVEILIFGHVLHLRLFEASLRSQYEPTAKELAAQAKGEWSFWAKWQFTPSGRLQVLVNEGYGGKIVDSDSRPVELQLNKLVGLMAARAVEFLVREERQAVEDAERQRVRDIALEGKRRQDAEKQRLAKLEIDAQNWKRAQVIREYLNALEQSAERQELSMEQLELLRWGHAKADWIDPLKPDVVDVLDEEIVIPR